MEPLWLSGHYEATMGYVCHCPILVLACSLRDALTDRQQGAFWDLVRADEREDGAVLALLTHKQTGKKLLAASTHLFWNPAFPDIKLAQGELLCKMVSQTVIPCACALTKCNSRLLAIVDQQLWPCDATVLLCIHTSVRMRLPQSRQGCWVICSVCIIHVS